jgi:hypothetical protein
LASGSGLSMIAKPPPLAVARRAVIDKAGSVSPIMVAAMNGPGQLCLSGETSSAGALADPNSKS